MRSILRVSAAVVCAAFAVCFASSASADGINIAAGDYVRLGNGYGSGGGGEFDGAVQEWNGSAYVNATPAVTWYSFCVEVDEYFTYGELLRVDAVSDTAQNGGSNTNSGDALDFKTAWLYTKLVNGTLDGLNVGGTAVSGHYADSRTANATHLQKAIWYIEGESLGVNNYYVTLAQNAVNNGWNTIGNVRILNLERYNSTTGLWGVAQDQLVMVAVPEPGTLLLMGLGLAAAGGVRRRNRAARVV